MYKFILLTQHTDKELTLILQDSEDKGLRLCSVKGNFFKFRNNTEELGKVCCTSFFPPQLEVPVASQVAEECVNLREKGWDTLCISGPETVFDSKRHIFLIKEKDNARDIVPDEKSEKQVKKRAKRKAFSSLAICILYLAVLALLFKFDLINIASDNLYLFFSLFSIPAVVFAIIRCSVALREQFRKEPENLRILDKSTATVMILLLIFALFLFADAIWNNNKINDIDSIPVCLEDFGIDTSGLKRIKKFTRSSSFICSYTHFFDEVLDKDADSDDVKYLSCSIFSSDCTFINKKVLKQLAKQNPEALIRTDSNRIISVKFGFRPESLQIENFFETVKSFQ